MVKKRYQSVDVSNVVDYFDPEDVLKIGDKVLSAITYRYVNNKLFSIDIDFVSTNTCYAARTIVDTVESQYQVKMKVHTPPTRPDVFAAVGEREGVRFSSSCLKNGWLSTLSITYLPLLHVADKAVESARMDLNQKQILKEKSDF